MKKISSFQSLFQSFLDWLFYWVSYLEAFLPEIKDNPLIMTDDAPAAMSAEQSRRDFVSAHSPEGERVLLVRAAKNFELKKRGEIA